ncbi:30S ribosomal protein S7, partial [Candidatus Dojkabacteria bacterium]|nr:30S ribosomal protein S7 [Candidatus Dojkabacteria bacterium]
MRGKRAPVRPIKPDEVHNSVLVSKFINYVMYDGQKQTARTIVYKAIEDLANKTKTKGTEALEKAIENARPKIEVRSRRIGGANFQVPVPVSEKRQTALALKWILEAARASRKNTEFWVVLSKELQNAYNKEGSAIKKKEEVLRMAEANKAF